MTPKSLENIYNIYHYQLLNYIKKRVPNLIIAEDILHDVFERVQNKLHMLKDEQKVKQWIFQIAHNMIADFFRKDKTTDFIKDDIRDYSSVNLEIPVYQRLELSVLEMIQRLPLKYRQSLFLADYKGLSYREIAIKQKVSLTCVKSRVQRARKMMKEIYLKCCHFELDVNGKVIDYYPH